MDALDSQLDADLDSKARPDAQISPSGSRVRVDVITAREDVVAARAARALIR